MAVTMKRTVFSVVIRVVRGRPDVSEGHIALKKEAIYSSDTSVGFKGTTWRYIPEK
jgi:hypothetical protein